MDESKVDMEFNYRNREQEVISMFLGKAHDLLARLVSSGSVKEVTIDVENDIYVISIDGESFQLSGPPLDFFGERSLKAMKRVGMISMKLVLEEKNLTLLYRCQSNPLILDDTPSDSVSINFE